MGDLVSLKILTSSPVSWPDQLCLKRHPTKCRCSSWVSSSSPLAQPCSIQILYASEGDHGHKTHPKVNGAGKPVEKTVHLLCCWLAYLQGPRSYYEKKPVSFSKAFFLNGCSCSASQRAQDMLRLAVSYACAPVIVHTVTSSSHQRGPSTAHKHRAMLPTAKPPLHQPCKSLSLL